METREKARTVSQAVAEWLKQYKNIKIDTNHLYDEADRYGLYKSPNRTVKNFINYEYEITEYYQFLARQNSVSDAERQDSDMWMEAFTYWADDYSFSYKYPALSGNRKITSIEATGMPAPIEATDRETLYQISLSVTYTREREDI